MMNSEATTGNGGSPPKRQKRDFRRSAGRGGRGRGGRSHDYGSNEAGRGRSHHRQFNDNAHRRRRNNNRKTSDADAERLVPSMNETKSAVAATVVEDAEMKETCNQTPEGKSRHQFSTTLFSQCSNISTPSQRALSEVLNYSYMTKVQEATLPSILANHDVVAKAKTGSGKTMAFLLPILEKLMTTEADTYITAVVLSPTRELTQQIAVEFQKLSTFHSQQNRVYISMIGGTSIDKDKKALSTKSKLRLLLATPGRLQDHLNQNTANIVQRLSRVQILCLDEADRLLDMGFRDALKIIIGYMPQTHSAGGRQTLLFSATFPESLKSMTDLAVKVNHTFIDTLDENEADANVQVLQQSAVVSLQHHILAMHEILQRHIQECQSKRQSYKIIVFFTTARIAGFMAELFLARYPNYYSTTNLWEIHSRKSQSHRMKVAQKFMDGTNCILFSSDVSARGLDYPNVSFVLQLGAPSEKAQYIHRLGRTARAGNTGSGVLLLCDFEREFLKEVQDLDVSSIQISIQDKDAHEEQRVMKQLIGSNDTIQASASSAYQAFMGYYNSNIKRLRLQNKHELVKISNEYATVIGFDEGEPPALMAKTVGKMGLKGVPGIRIDREGGGGGGGGGRNNGRGRGKGGRERDAGRGNGSKRW